MSCLFNLGGRALKKQQKRIIGAPQLANGNTPHNPWEEETGKIQHAMGATLMLPTVASMPSSLETQLGRDAEHLALPITTAKLAEQTDASHQHIEKDPWRQPPPLPGWEAVAWNERGFATRCEYVGDEVAQDHNPNDDDFKLPSPTRKSPPALHRLREQESHKPTEQVHQAPQISPINFSRPLPPSGKHRSPEAKQEEATPPTSSCESSLEDVSTPVPEQKPFSRPLPTLVPRSPPQTQRRPSGNGIRVISLPAPPPPPRFKSRLGSNGIKIGVPPALDDPDVAMGRSRKLLHAVHDLTNRLLRHAERDEDGSSTLLPSMIEVLTRAMRSVYAMWRVLHSIKYDADMVYVRDAELLSDLAAHLEGMAARIVPPKQAGTSTTIIERSARAAAELNLYVKTLFRFGARLMLVTGLGKDVLADGWETMKETSKLEALRSGLERTAMSVEMKVEGRLHREAGKEW